MATEKFGKTFTHSLFEIFFLIILHGKNNTERIIGKKIRLGDKGGKKVKSKKKKNNRIRIIGMAQEKEFKRP